MTRPKRKKKIDVWVVINPDDQISIVRLLEVTAWAEVIAQFPELVNEPWKDCKEHAKSEGWTVKRATLSIDRGR